MTTITEILAEAFSRVKAEHGVTLSRVEFNGAGIEFSASSGTAPRGKWFLDDGDRRVRIPEGATHTDVPGYHYFYRYVDGSLYIWKQRVGWQMLRFSEPSESLQLLGRLTALPANPT